ncbi:hypothetical protein [Micromonospora sp. NPDC001898]|uniref:hypothetical protein n=1 Tax=Micromonospora sp. NPDC001898 TaxID=3364221 RepID=UPI0036AAE8A0
MRISLVAYVVILGLFFAAVLALAVASRRGQRKQRVDSPKPPRASEEPRRQHVDHDPDDPDDPYNYSGSMTGV